MYLDLVGVVGDCSLCWCRKWVKNWILVLEEADRRRGWKMLLVWGSRGAGSTLGTFLGWRANVEWALLNFERGRFETKLVCAGDTLTVDSGRGWR